MFHTHKMNPNYGISARRSIMQNAPGAGGFAGHTVPLSDPNRVVGGSGMNMETNPVRVHDDSGAVVDFPTYDGTYRPAHLEVVESWRRDPVAFPTADTFRLNFSKPLRSVFAIEVMEINVPNVDAVAPQHREFLLCNGLNTEPEPGRYRFIPQGSIPKDRSLHTMSAHTSNDPNIDRSAPLWDNTKRMQLDDFAFARLPYDSTEPFQHFDRNGWKRTTWFPTPIDRLDGLEFALLDVYGVPYDFAANEEWSATLLILSKA